MDEVITFNCQGKEYAISIEEKKVYPRFFGIIGLLEIGYGTPVVVKSITFDLRTNYKSFLGMNISCIRDRKEKHSYSFVKEFISELSKSLKNSNISDSDIIHYKAISNSRKRLFARLLDDSGWKLIDSCDGSYYSKTTEYNSAMFEQIRLFGEISITINV
jgi:hypothetical protein